MRIRPLEAADEPAVTRLIWAALPPQRAEGADESIARRLRDSLERDPGGAWVAEDEGGLAGIALAVRREGIWVLAWLGVHPGVRSQGLGGRLIEAALGWGEGCRGFLIASSDDPRAMRLYSRAGFDAQPSLRATGVPRLDGAPSLAAVGAGGDDDLDHCVEVDRAVRGGGRRSDIEGWLEQGARLHVTSGGYAVGHEGRPATVAATSDEEASLLLWRVLADAGDDEAQVDWITARQGWAVRTVLDAGLKLDRGDAYFTRGELGPLTPWLPNNSLL